MIGEGARGALAGGRFADVAWVAETGSTNQDLLDAARGGAPEGRVLVADHQTAGRGRLGRVWVAPPGASLLCSVLLRPPLPADQAHLVTCALALAAADACRRVGGVEPRLKWPNDLVVDDRKLAGLLAESVVAAGALAAVVVGIGLNVTWPADLPAELAGIATALNHLGAVDVGREDLLVALLTSFEPRYAALCGGGGAALLAEVGERSATLGRRVRVETGSETFEGEATALGAGGRLVVTTAEGTREVTVGDVTHLRHT
jgi:BirA family transcriptional regulator, biotin operon repressor / biotin---[acetyl-CoA-carboxylase] ligase